MRLHVVLVFVVKFVDFPSIFCARLLTPQIGFMLVVNQALHNNSYSWVEYPFSLAFGLFFFECPMIAQHQTRLFFAYFGPTFLEQLVGMSGTGDSQRCPRPLELW